MKKIVLIGAGSAQFGYGTIGEIFSSEAFIDSEIVLLDINPKALETVRQTAQSYVKEKGLATKITATLLRASIDVVWSKPKSPFRISRSSALESTRAANIGMVSIAKPFSLSANPVSAPSLSKRKVKSDESTRAPAIAA